MCNVRGRLRVVSSYPKSHRDPWTDCGARRRVTHFWLDHDALDLIEADLIAPAIVELGRARRGVVRHRCGLLKRAAVLEIGRDVLDLGARAVERVVVSVIEFVEQFDKLVTAAGLY